MTEFRNLDTDNTLGGAAASHYKASSQKAVKEYVDKKISELPVLYGIWSDVGALPDNWGLADSVTYYYKRDYPQVWDLLVSILNEETESDDITVISIDDAEAILESNAQTQEALVAKINLACSYIVDINSEKFQLPRCIPDGRCLGPNHYTVVTGSATNNGTFTLKNNGHYEEAGFIARYETATKTVQEVAPIEVQGHQVVLSFTCPDNEQGIPVPACEVKLYEVSSKGYKIHTLKNFGDGAAYTFTYDNTYSDIKLYLPGQRIKTTANSYYTLSFDKCCNYIRANNSRIEITTSLNVLESENTLDTSNSAIDLHIPHLQFMPNPNGNDANKKVTVSGDGYFSTFTLSGSSGSKVYSNGSRTISAQGSYTTDDVTIQDTVITHTVNKSYSYYKITEYDDAESVIATSTRNDDDIWKPLVETTNAVTFNFARKMLEDSGYHSMFLFIHKAEEEGNGAYSLGESFGPHGNLQYTGDGGSIYLWTYDEQVGTSSIFQKIIASGDDETKIAYKVTGYTIPPAVSEYQNARRLYIKLKD